MALDAAFLSFLKTELSKAQGAKVDKIYQPSKEEMVLSLRSKEYTGRLMLSAQADCARIHFTALSPDNPQNPPMFCMLMRKVLGGARLRALRQPGMERVLFLDFDTVNELGDPAVITIAVEIMGRHSNIIVMDEQNKIIDAIKRVGPTMSSVRPILPGLTYQMPPSQEKTNLLDTTGEQALKSMLQSPAPRLQKAFMETLAGFSPIVSREFCQYTAQDVDVQKEDLTSEQQDKAVYFLNRLIHLLKTQQATPYMVLDAAKKPLDFTFMDVHQYGSSALVRPMESFSALLDSFYNERALADRLRQRANDLLKLLANTQERIARKLDVQRQELVQSEGRETLKMYGDLLSANLYQIQKGSTAVTLPNFYSETGEEVNILLDPLLTPAQNAQKYYTEYKKAATAERKLLGLIAQGEEELKYLDSVFDELTRASGEQELLQIRQELASSGYLRHYKEQKGRGEHKLAPMRFCSDDGFTILVGRNNVQNDQLTLRQSRNCDIWFHTQKIPGSHTVIITEGKEVPNRTLEQAAIIAAYHSKARHSALVPVDYTPIKHVKKVPGAKPGMVIYDVYQTAIVTPDEELVLRLTAR